MLLEKATWENVQTKSFETNIVLSPPPPVESFWKDLIWLISNVKVTTLRSSHISIFSEYSPHKLKSDQNFLQILNISMSPSWRWRRWLMFLKRAQSLKGQILFLDALYSSQWFKNHVLWCIICSTLMDLKSWPQALWGNWLSKNIADMKSFTSPLKYLNLLSNHNHTH